MASTIRARAGTWLGFTTIGLSILVLGLLATVLLTWQTPLAPSARLSVGNVAQRDIESPRALDYESTLLTEQARDRVAASIPQQYDGPDDQILRRQREIASRLITEINAIRDDANSNDEQKVQRLMALDDLDLSAAMAQQVLELTPAEWQGAALEIPSALRGAMRDEIRESTLEIERRGVRLLVQPELSRAAFNVAVEIVQQLMRPNMFPNDERTQSLRESARRDTPPERVVFARGENIIRKGDVVTELDIEAIRQAGLLQPAWDWWLLVRSASFVLVLLSATALALYYLSPEVVQKRRLFSSLLLLTSVYLLIAKLMLPASDWTPYLFPIAALGMLLATLINLRVALVVVIAFTLLTNYMVNGNPMLVTYVGLGGLLGALMMGRHERLTAFLWAGAAVGASNALVMVAFYAPFTRLPASMDGPRLLLTVLLNGGLSASLALIGYYLLGNLFGLTTTLQLTELSRPTHPLLRQLLLKAPGTYHHTIIVSNMAERAAAAIGADAFLTRVGAYYHDIGKMSRPFFFVENTNDEISPHNKLDPQTSAQIITSHVTDGVALAQKYRLPPRIQDFIREHHGRSVVKYFFVQAQQRAVDRGDDPETVSRNDFRYEGPNPQSRETAVLMLADTCEAAVRALKPATREELDALVNRLIDERIDSGELDECNLTLHDLSQVKTVFIQMLQGVHHPRITYPGEITTYDVAAVRTRPAPGPGPSAQPSAPRATNGQPRQPASPRQEGVTIAEGQRGRNPLTNGTKLPPRRRAVDRAGD